MSKRVAEDYFIFFSFYSKLTFSFLLSGPSSAYSLQLSNSISSEASFRTDDDSKTFCVLRGRKRKKDRFMVLIAGSSEKRERWVDGGGGNSKKVFLSREMFSFDFGVSHNATDYRSLFARGLVVGGEMEGTSMRQ